MKFTRPTARMAVALATVLFAWQSGTAQETNAPSARPTPEQLRSQWSTMTPEQRQARVRELQRQHPNTNDWATGSWPAELKDLTPEQRRAKVKELREKFIASQAAGQPEANVAEQRQARLRTKLAELQKKQAAGKLTPDERQQLDRLEEAVKRFGQPAPAAHSDAQPGVVAPAEVK